MIELLVSLVVLAVLSAVAVPAYDASVRKARRAEGRAAVLTVLQQQEVHYSRYGRYQPFSAEQPHGFKWFSGERAASSAYELEAVACTWAPNHPCIQVSAKPRSERVGVRFQDAGCGTLALASDGRKISEGKASGCW